MPRIVQIPIRRERTALRLRTERRSDLTEPTQHATRMAHIDRTKEGIVMAKIDYVAGVSLAATFACCLAGSANAQLVAHKDLTTSIAFTMAETAVQTCKQQGFNVSANV